MTHLEQIDRIHELERQLAERDVQLAAAHEDLADAMAEDDRLREWSDALDATRLVTFADDPGNRWIEAIRSAHQLLLLAYQLHGCELHRVNVHWTNMYGMEMWDEWVHNRLEMRNKEEE